MEHFQHLGRGFGGDRYQQAPRRLRIKQQVAVPVLQALGQMHMVFMRGAVAGARAGIVACLRMRHGGRKQRNIGQPQPRPKAGPFADFGQMAHQPKAGDIGHRVHLIHCPEIGADAVEHGGGGEKFRVVGRT
jgi:hypothetical protein